MLPNFHTKIIELEKVLMTNELISSIKNDTQRKNIQENSPHLDAFTFSYFANSKKYSGFYVSPKTKNQGPLPVIIYNRGGTGTFAYIKPYMLFSGYISLLVRNGYAVIGSQRMSFENNGTPDELGGEDFNSTLILKEFIVADSALDSRRIGVFGASMGAITTYRLLVETNWIKAAVVINGITDLKNNELMRPELIQHFKDTFGGDVEEKKRRSALYWTEKFSCNTPILLMTGTSDWRVDPRDSLRLSKKLLNHKIPHRLVMFEGADHSLSEHRDEAHQFTIEWFDRFVKNNEPIPNMEKH